jgi:hypothetical protein
MGGSSSSTSSASTAEQLTGGSGAISPVIQASPSLFGSSTVNIDAGQSVSLAAMNNMEDAVKAAFSFGSEAMGHQADANAAQAVNDTSLLSTILKSNSDLAANVQSGGAASAQQTTNYVIWGLLALGALFLLFRK